MKKIKLLILISAIVFMFTGCWDSVEISDREYLFAVGLDKSDKKINFTAEIPKINEGSEQSRLIYTSESDGFENFYYQSFLKSEKEISDRLMQVVVIGEDIAKDEKMLKKIFDEIQRSPQINRRVKIVLAKGRAEEIINTEIPNDPIVGRYLSDMLVKLKRRGYQDIYTFDEAILNLGKYGNGVIPVARSVEESIEVDSAGVVKDYKLLGYLNNEELEIVMMLLNPISSNLKNINVNIDDTTISLGAVDISLTRDINLDGEKLTVDYYVTLYSYIDSFLLGDNRLQDPKFLNSITDTAIKDISEKTKDVIYKIQNTYNTDILKIKDKLYKYHNIQYEKIADKYDDVFKNANINVSYNVKIKSVGLVK